jgi:hypothetical protein
MNVEPIETIRYYNLENDDQIILVVRALLDTVTIFCTIPLEELLQVLPSVFYSQIDHLLDLSLNDNYPKTNITIQHYSGYSYTWPISHQLNFAALHLSQLYQMTDLLRRHCAVQLNSQSIILDKVGLKNRIFILTRKRLICRGYTVSFGKRKFDALSMADNSTDETLGKRTCFINDDQIAQMFD